jgi:hypothetical protein
LDYVRRHLRIGWSALLVFASLGLILEALQGFKVAAYLDVSNETRRLMWRLAHAHGALLGAINILFALTLKASASNFPSAARISSSLIGATILLPLGFFLGGVVFYSGDPGLGVLLVPVGAMLLLLSLYWIASAVSKRSSGPDTARSAADRAPRL